MTFPIEAEEEKKRLLVSFILMPPMDDDDDDDAAASPPLSLLLLLLLASYIRPDDDDCRLTVSSPLPAAAVVADDGFSVDPSFPLLVLLPKRREILLPLSLRLSSGVFVMIDK